MPYTHTMQTMWQSTCNMRQRPVAVQRVQFSHRSTCIFYKPLTPSAITHLKPTTRTQQCSNRRRRGSSPPNRDDDDLQYALSVLSRDWPRLILPAAGIVLAVSIVGPMLLSAAFLAIAIAGVSTFFFAAPMLLGVGAAMMFGGVMVASTIGFAGLYVLPTLLSVAAVGASAWIGSRLVTDYFGGRRRDDDDDDMVVDAEFRDAPESYDAWTGRASSGSASRARRRDVDEDLERMQREAEEDLKTFDQMMKLKDKMRNRGDL